MTEEEIKEVIRKHCGAIKNLGDEVCETCQICNRIAHEIWLKQQSLLGQAKAQGRQEVIDWVKGEISMWTSDGGIFISGYIAGKKWQTKLKEWQA